jgi:hypothetical protein
MTELLTIIGASFSLAGMAFGLTSVFWGSKLQDFLFDEHNDVFRKLSAPGADPGDEGYRAVSSANLWKYEKSPEGNDLPGIRRYKNRIMRSFMLFCIFSLMGIASFLAVFIVFLFS